MSTVESDYNYSNNRDSSAVDDGTVELPLIRPPSFPPPPPPMAISNPMTYQTIQPRFYNYQDQQQQQDPEPQVMYAAIPGPTTLPVRLQGSDREPFFPNHRNNANHLNSQPHYFGNQDYPNSNYSLQKGSILRNNDEELTYSGNHPAIFYQIPPEASVAKPLAVIAFFFCCQFWFSIPALVLAYKRNKPRSTYRSSIGLSVTAIVLGICLVMAVGSFVVLYCVFGQEMKEWWKNISRRLQQ